ncbi:MAG: DUF3396 domain-containing protein [Rhizobiaceae bacterium]|nr:DUF3396 domain-containing protein [Rhizobiaceae bacterium]MCV0408032.1 DUF3396 domain-containing protein [Rhizobiaceae bacterium]
MTQIDLSVPSSNWTLADQAQPAFRLFAHLSFYKAHPYVFTEQYEALFALFAPILKERCDKIMMWDRPGANARRGNKIKPDDWRPFEHIKSIHSDPSNGIFTGFYFVDKSDKDMKGRGLCSFRFFVGSSIRLDACIPLEDWQAGRLDVEALVAVLQTLPYFSFSAGYGLSLSDQFDNAAAFDLAEMLIPVAHRYPALDLQHAEQRNAVPKDEADASAFWIGGVNWLTGVGEPFVSALGGAPALARGLPAGIDMNSGSSGVVFRLGEHPITGEAGVDDTALPLYRQLGQRLRPIGYPDADSLRKFVFGKFKQAESLAWMRRFYDS